MLAVREADDTTNVMGDNSINGPRFAIKNKNVTIMNGQLFVPPAVRFVIAKAENATIQILNSLYNILNSGTEIGGLDRLTNALFRLSNSQGFYGALNYLFVASNFAQTYGGIIAGIALKDSKKKHEEDSISGAEVSDRLQSSIDELNDRLASSTDFLTKFIYCRYVNNVAGDYKRNKIRRVSKEVCSRHLQELEKNIVSFNGK